MPVQQCFPLRFLELELARIARQEFLEQQRAFRELAETQRRKLVAQREQARRLQSDDGLARERRQRFHHPARLLLRPFRHPGREKGPSAAQPARRVYAIAGGFQHLHRRARVVRLEVAVERVDEKDHVTAGISVIPEKIRAPPGQIALVRESERALGD